MLAPDHKIEAMLFTNWDLFFPSGSRVLALPSWRNPRLCLPIQQPLKLWEDSSFYPASRLSARLYRSFLRARAAAGLTEARQVRSVGWALGDFARDVLPQTRSAVVLAGTPGPTQKITVRVLGEQSEVLGYLKYAEKEAARTRLEHECRLLDDLPDEIGPRRLKFGHFGEGEALLTTVLEGKRVPATLHLDGALMDLLASLVVSSPMPLEAHPWVRSVREQIGSELDPWFEILIEKQWPIVVQHGDFAPWNLVRRPTGTLGAIDWEYGSLEGFPHLDLAYYVLQVLALIHRRAPWTAAEYAARYLSRHPRLALNEKETRALIRLAAYDAYLKSRDDGQPDSAKLQAWRRAVWEART